MKYVANNTEIKYTHNADGSVEFMLDGVFYRSVGQPEFDNSPNNNFSTYSAPLVCPDDAEYPDDTVGKIEWDIIEPDFDDESNACDWDKFDVYLYQVCQK